MLSLLTPEYQKRMVQLNYHEAVTNAPQWMASFCYPEGFMRWWAEASLGGDIEVMMTPDQVQFLSGIADNFLRRVLIGRKHVQQVPQWYGETVGFWNGNTLVAWTANVQGWTLSHSMFEFSSKMETIEVFTPSADGKTITVDTTFYDPEAFTRPLHTVTPWQLRTGLDDPDRRFNFVECRVQSTIVNGPDGRPTQLHSRRPGFIDYFGRPWAQNWEEHFEKGWMKPEEKIIVRKAATRHCIALVVTSAAGMGPSLLRDVRPDDDQDADRASSRATCQAPTTRRSSSSSSTTTATPVMKNGKPMQFGVETGSAIAMARSGVTVKTMAEGTFITVRFYPLRDGRDFGALAGMLVTLRNDDAERRLHGGNRSAADRRTFNAQ